MRKMLALVLVSLVVLPPQAFAQQDGGAGVALNDAPVAIAAVPAVGAARLSTNAPVRPGPLRDAIGRAAAQLNQGAAVATTPRHRNVKRPLIWSTVIGAVVGGLFYNVAVECGSSAGDECTEYWARGGAVGGAVGAAAALLWAYSK